MIEKITEFLKTCPYLSDYNVTAEFLGEKGGCIGVFVKAGEPLVERYADGGALKQVIFCISLRSTNHQEKPGSACELFNHLGEWLESSVVFPELGKGRLAQQFEVLKNGAMAKRSYGTNRYDMDCRLIYYTEKGSEV